MWNWLKSKGAQVQVGQAQEAIAAEERTNRVIVITGTSGSGRKAIAKRLSEETRLPYVKSLTTREMRSREQIGYHYRFVSEAEFGELKAAQAFAQYVHLERGWYGLLKEELDQALTAGDVIVVLNHDGLQALRRLYPGQVVCIFVYVTKEDVGARLAKEMAPQEIVTEYERNYTEQVIHKRDSDYLLQNMSLESTVEKIQVYLGRKPLGSS